MSLPPLGQELVSIIIIIIIIIIINTLIIVMIIKSFEREIET